jgi:TatD DNase family protein
LFETDAPWLAPTPYRGKQNQSLYVQKTLETLAEIKQVSIEQMEKITDENFNRFYLTGDK